MLQIHATIPTNTKSLLEQGVRNLMAVFMANQEKLGVGPEEVSWLQASPCTHPAPLVLGMVLCGCQLCGHPCVIRLILTVVMHCATG